MDDLRKLYDAADLQILAILLKDSRTPLQEISSAVNLSTTSCWNRIKRMTDSGLLEAYTVRVDLASLGYHDTVIVQVTLLQR